MHTFIRLDSDYTLSGHDDPCVVTTLSPLHSSDSCSYLYPICEGPIPSKFSTTDEASICLEAITAQIFDLFDDLWLHTQSTLSKKREMTSLEEDMENCLVRAALRTVELDSSHLEGIQEARHKLRVWTIGFASTSKTTKNLISNLSTHMFFFCVWIWAEAWRDPTAMLVDRFHTQFEHMVSLCEQYVETHIAKTPFCGSFLAHGSSQTARLTTPPAFSLGSGVVTCLIAIVERCRDSSTRQRCISTMRKINLRGVFDTEYLVAYLLAIVELEEGAAQLLSGGTCAVGALRPDEVPEAARTLEVVMSPSWCVSNFDFYKMREGSIIHVGNTCDDYGNALGLGDPMVRTFRLST